MSDVTIASLTTILAVLVGGLLNHFVVKWTKDKDWAQSRRKEQIETRSRLYADFLSGAQKLVAQSIDSKFSNVTQFGILYNELARIELLSTDDVIKKANAIANHVLELHVEGDKEPEEKYSKLKKDFISAVKTELKSFEDA